MTNIDANRGLAPAEDNPWYLLATLYGVPTWDDTALQAKNRIAWNRYYASIWSSKERNIIKDKINEVELTPFDDDEIIEIQNNFNERSDNNVIKIPEANKIIDFSKTYFGERIRFNGFNFASSRFIGTSFSGTVDFQDSIFFRFSSFQNSTFSAISTFNGAVFFNISSFSDSNFLELADFRSTSFYMGANFKTASFFKGSSFSNASFSEKVLFGGASFFDSTLFNGATFHGAVIFTNTNFKAPTDFDGCRFEKYPPQLDGATLHQRMNWRRVTWPSLQGLELSQVEDLTDAYSFLKLEMERQKRHHDELMFFSKELECRKVEQGKIKGFPISVYAWTCDYGQSIILPFIWLVNLILLSWNVIMSAYMPEITWGKALLVSIANSLGSFGIRKELMDILPKTDSTGMQMFLMVQSIVALILLFLIGLGLRNRFRMK